MASLTFPVKVCVPPAINFGMTANPAHTTIVVVQTSIIRKRDINLPPVFSICCWMPASAAPFGCNLIRLFANLFSSTLSRQGLLHPAFRARLQVEGVALHFLNDVFRLNFALEATEGVVY